MDTPAMYPVIRRIRMTIIGWGSTMVREALPKGTIGHTGPLRQSLGEQLRLAG